MARVDVDEDTLKMIASETGGKFFRATDTQSLKSIYAEIDRLEKTKHEFKKFEHHTELFAWAIVPALAVLGTSFGLSHALPSSALTKFMQFAQPIWLLAGLAACAALVWQFRRFDRRQRVALTQFASARLLPKLASSISTSRKLAKRVLFTLGV